MQSALALPHDLIGITGCGVFISQPLAIVVIGGLTSSTLLTLVLVPVLYTLAERQKLRRTERRRAKQSARRQAKKSPQAAAASHDPDETDPDVAGPGANVPESAQTEPQQAVLPGSRSDGTG